MISLGMHCIPVDPQAPDFNPFTLETLAPNPCIPVFKNDQGRCKQLNDANLMIYINLPYWQNLSNQLFFMHGVKQVGHELYSN